MLQTNQIGTLVFRFIGLLMIQILLLNNIQLFGYAQPIIYILFIISFPLTANKSLVIFLGFVLGLIVDIYSNSGGVHAAATSLIAYLRPSYLKYSFGVSYEYNTIVIAQAEIKQQLLYLVLMILTHHLCLFLLEHFSFNHILFTLETTLITALMSGIIIYSTIILLSPYKKR